MDVTGVRITQTRVRALSRARTCPRAANHLERLYRRRPCHLIMSDDSVLARVRALLCDVAERK